MKSIRDELRNPIYNSQEELRDSFGDKMSVPMAYENLMNKVDNVVSALAGILIQKLGEDWLRMKDAQTKDAQNTLT